MYMIDDRTLYLQILYVLQRTLDTLSGTELHVRHQYYVPSYLNTRKIKIRITNPGKLIITEGAGWKFYVQLIKKRKVSTCLSNVSSKKKK